MADSVLSSIVDPKKGPEDVLAAANFDLWVPNAFAASGSIYILRASHRGDMYHIRGAMTLEPHPILVYETTDRTTDLTAYLAKPVPSAANVFLTPWTWSQLTSSTNPGASYSKRNFTLISESEATQIIRQGVTGAAQKTQLKDGMAIIDRTDEPDLRDELKDLAKRLFAGDPKPSETTILIQTRDTGTQGGVYPELDSGTDSVLKIARWITAIPRKGTEALRVVLAGNARQIEDLPSIGEYYLQINSARWPNQTKRDIEAFFLKVASEERYYSFAVGFRSGVLDLFTFLGIPSISVSVRQMVGEGRHGLLALNPLLSRWNLQYELPRHITTKYFSASGTQLLGSPWWNFDKSREPTPAEKAQQSNPPSGFNKYDSEIVRIGIYKAIVFLLPWRIDPFVKPTTQSREFTNAECRLCYFSDTPYPRIRAFMEGQRVLEREDFATRRAEVGQRNEAPADFDRWLAQMENSWTEILQRYPPA